MKCPFLKKTTLKHSGLSNPIHTSHEESFCNCIEKECMAYNANDDHKCALVTKGNITKY